MATSIYSLKRNQFQLSDWSNFKNAVKQTSKHPTLIQTGKSKTMLYIKANGKDHNWKKVLGQGTKFNYVPSGKVGKVAWNGIKVRVN